MKRLFLLMFCLAGAFAKAQLTENTQKVYKYAPEAYEAMKSNGTLPTDGIIQVVLQPLAEAKASKFNPPANATQRGGGSCGCYVEPDGTYTLAMPPNDDGSTGIIPLPFNFCFYGTNYNSLYINNNGNVSFGTPYGTFSPVGFPSNQYVMVAPFWGDVDTRNGLGQVVYKIYPNAIYINWEDVGYYSMHGDKLNTFQLILSDGTDPIAGLGKNVAFCYQDMAWTTGDASNGINGFGGFAATVGANKGDGVNYIQMGQFDMPGTTYDGPFLNNDGVSWLDYQTLRFDVCVTNNNIAPVFSDFQPGGINAGGSGCGDTIKICDIGDTLLFSAQAIDPNPGDIVTLTASAPGVSGFTVLSSTPGNPANIYMQIITNVLNVGMNYIDITATDNGVPTSSSVLSFWVFVDTTGIGSVTPDIVGDTILCDGETTTLTVTPSGLDSYSWNTGATTASISGITDSSSFYCTVGYNNGCYKTIFQDVYEFPNPNPVIYGPLNFCNGTTTALTTDPIYTTYSWDNNGNIISTTPSANAMAGTIILTVVDSNGCTGDTSAMITSNTPVVNAFGTAGACPGTPILLYATSSGPGTFTWSNGAVNDSTTITTSGNYVVTFTDATGCSNSDTFAVNYWPVPNADFSFSPDTAFDLNTTVQFTDLSTVPSPGTIVNWYWFIPGDTFYLTQNPTHIFDSYGQHSITLYVGNQFGCVDSVTYDFWVIPPLVAPNVFSPGTSPGYNDLLEFKNLEFFGPARLEVYNRWGILLYESGDYKNDWDGKVGGKMVADGTYYYVLRLANGKKYAKSLTIFIK